MSFGSRVCVMVLLGAFLRALAGTAARSYLQVPSSRRRAPQHSQLPPPRAMNAVPHILALLRGQPQPGCRWLLPQLTHTTPFPPPLPTHRWSLLWPQPSPAPTARPAAEGAWRGVRGCPTAIPAAARAGPRHSGQQQRPHHGPPPACQHSHSAADHPAAEAAAGKPGQHAAHPAGVSA